MLLIAYLRFLQLVKQKFKFDTLLFIYNICNGTFLESSDLRSKVISMFHVVFTQKTKSTLDDFGRRSIIISATPRKLSGV